VFKEKVMGLYFDHVKLEIRVCDKWKIKVIKKHPPASQEGFLLPARENLLLLSNTWDFY
jgi:hypothetical protein